MCYPDITIFEKIKKVESLQLPISTTCVLITLFLFVIFLAFILRILSVFYEYLIFIVFYILAMVDFKLSTGNLFTQYGGHTILITAK